jgi:ATP-dependent Clp protease, protease subunit
MHDYKAMVAGDREWFRVQAKKGNAAEVFIFDQIGRGFFGGGVAPEEFIKQVKALKLEAGDELTVHINSPGGNVFDGNAIHNYLRTLKARTVVRIDGVAASIASVIAMAGDRIEMPANAMMFIHNPETGMWGNAAALRKLATDLDNIRESMSSAYLRRIVDRIDRAQLYALLDAETWLSADEAVAKGFADVVDEPVRAAALAQFDLAKYGYKVPQAIVAAKKAHQEDIRRRREALKLLQT